MLNNKIALKLSLSFALALIIFSIIISGVFLVLFKQYTVDLHKTQLQNYAQSLAQSLSSVDDIMAWDMARICILVVKLWAIMFGL